MVKIIERRAKVIGIVGSRRRNTFADYQLCRETFDKVYRKGDSIVSGGCQWGADNFAERIAKELGIPIMIYYPRQEDLDKALLEMNSRAAFAKLNYARNTLIAQHCDVLIAVVAEDRNGGTEDTIKKALKLKKKVIYVE